MRTGFMQTKINEGAEQGTRYSMPVRERGRQAGRFGWRMRAGAWITMLSTLGLYVTAIPARAEHIHRVMEANKPHARVVNELKAGTTDKLTPAQWKAVDAKRAQEAAAREAKKPDVRVLSLKEMQAAHGSGPYRNAYFAGTLPWHRSLRDVNLCNGNLFKSFTDVQVAPGKGAGLALQRTYNSQDARPGPFGVGWQQCYDIRMEEENPTSNSTSDSLNIADRTDSFGAKHKYHRDCDGLYSPPPYLFDETSSDYQAFLVNGPIAPLDDTQIGMDGTTKHFTNVGNNVRACDYIQDRYGNKTVLTYGVTLNGNTVPNLLASVTDPMGRELVFTWNNLGTANQPVYRIVKVDSPQYSVVYNYNGDANLASVTLDAGDATHLNRTTTYGFTSVGGPNGTESGLLSSVTDPLGHSVSYTYDDPTQSPLGTVSPCLIQEPGGVNANGQPRINTWNRTAFSVGSNGLVVKFNNANDPNDDHTDDLSGVTAFTDMQLRCAGVGQGMSIAAAYMQTYDTANNVTHATSMPGGAVNLNGQSQTGQTDEMFTYGPHGNQLTHTSTGFSGTETTTYYNGSQFFQKKSVTDANGHTTTFGVGNKTAGTVGDPDTNIGDRGSVLWVKDAKYGDGTLNASGMRFSYQYNAAGQKTSETNQNGVVTNYAYGDAWGNLTNVVQDPTPNPADGQTHLNRVTSMTYDQAGHVLTSTDPKGQQSSFAYNNLGQPTSASFPATQNTPAETVNYTYDVNGRTLSVSDNRGTTLLAYENGCDRVHSVTDPVTGTMSYTYLVSGERASLNLPGGGTWTYQYGSNAAWSLDGCLLPRDDPNSHVLALASIVDDQGRRIEFGYDANSWNSAGRLHRVRSNQAYTTGTSPALVSYQETLYAYDYSSAVPSNQTHNRLMEMQTTFHWIDVNSQWHSKLLVQNEYTYDTAGQRLTNTLSSLDNTGNLTFRTEQYAYDELNRLTGVDYGDGQTQGYTFDSMGNRMSKTDAGGGIGGTENYAYNNANMLLSRAGNPYLNDANGNTLSGGGRTNTWDSQNRLASCSYNGNVSSFTYSSDGLRHSSVVNGVSTDFVLDQNMFVRELHNGAVKATYFMGASGPVYRRDDANGGSLRWYLYDGLGSVLGEVDPQGNIAARRKYDVYGAARSVTGTPTSKHAFVGSLGHDSEDEVGLIYMRARYIDATTGRFISQDPQGHGVNWFNYCSANPVNRVDADGKTDEMWGMQWWGLRNEWRFSLAEAPQFRLVAAAFLALWFELTVQEAFGGSFGTALDSAIKVEGLARDYNEFLGKAPRSGFSIGEQVEAFYSGWAAAEEITYMLLFRDDWQVGE